MDGGVEVDAIENLIDADEEQIGCRPFQDGQIIAGGERDESAGGLLVFDPGEEVGFGGHACKFE
jgi:hypothetical protein